MEFEELKAIYEKLCQDELFNLKYPDITAYISEDDINTLQTLDLDLGIMIDEDGMTYFSQTSDKETLNGDHRYGRCGR